MELCNGRAAFNEANASFRCLIGAVSAAQELEGHFFCCGFSVVRTLVFDIMAAGTLYDHST